MKAAYLDASDHAVIRNVPVPELDPSEVLIRVRACGICGSDLGMYRAGMEDRILGHEFSGEIVKVAPDVQGWKEGDRVTVEPTLVCWECHWCKKGQFELCESLGFTGIMSDGGFAEYAKVPTYQLHRLPDEVSFIQGALVEPLSVSLHGVLQSQLKPGDPVAVFGCGIIGLFAMLWARTLGAGKIIATEVKEARIKAGQALADVVLNPMEVDVAAEMARLTDELGPSVVYECSGASASQVQAIDLVRRGGQVVILGIAHDPLVPINLSDVAMREIAIKGSLAYSSLRGSGEFPTALQFIRDRRITPECVPLTQIPLDDIDAGFQAALAGKVAKVIVIP